MRVMLTTVLMLVMGGVGMAPEAVAQQVNACGCYRDTDGSCRCTKTKKKVCTCAGDCEPVGCEEIRQKQADKEAEAALKRIDAKEKKKAAEAERDAKKGKKKGKGSES
jgi:hypothetical protein